MNKYTGWRKEFAPQNQTTVNCTELLFTELALNIIVK